LIDALQRLIGRFDNDPLLLEPNQLRQRFEALDLLDAYFPDTPEPVLGTEPSTVALYRQARAFCARLEAVNSELYQTIRNEIQRGAGLEALLQWIPSSAEMEEVAGPVNGMGYDYLDELISGVFQFEEPEAELDQREAEMVFYQPTPARLIFRLIGLTALTASDVLVDLGSGLGHVSLLISICTRARSVGIELESTYVERARQCAQRLNLNTVTFLQQDARAADLSTGTVFYLHTPFTGSILRRVLDLLRCQAATRRIRICTYGPCTSVLSTEPWLEAGAEIHRITLFRSRD
jgi:predicted RNA methylase